ncbi:MAG: flagellar protein FlaG [Peptococcaceae bacterium]|nr:flagellar protein FlaG [Peptococcaceae bacterium]
MAVNPVKSLDSISRPNSVTEKNPTAPPKSQQGQKVSKEQHDTQENQAPTEEQLVKALEKLTRTAYIFDRMFHFLIHKESERVMVQIIDRETEEVIKEIPPEKILDIVARIQELVGLLIDEKV